MCISEHGEDYGSSVSFKCFWEYQVKVLILFKKCLCSFFHTIRNSGIFSVNWKNVVEYLVIVQNIFIIFSLSFKTPLKCADDFFAPYPEYLN